MAPRETENNAYSNFWGDKQRALWYVMVFSGVVNCEKSVDKKIPLILHTKHAIYRYNRKRRILM